MKQKKSKVKFLWPIIGLLLVLAWYYYFAVNRANDLASAITVTVAKGESARQIADSLAQSGAIRSANFFRWHLWLAGLSARIQAGDYTIKSGESILDVAALLTAAHAAVPEKTILLREGLTNREMIDELKKNNWITDDSFAKLSATPIKNLPTDWVKLYPWLAQLPPNADLEGYLFPDTYRLFATDGGQVLIAKMLANFTHKVDAPMLADIQKSGHSLAEIITMASIIEKEVRSEADRRLVSGLFWQRIKNGQALQSCATLSYILGVNKAQYTYADTQIVSPYNTYLHRGLPPGPIANPSLSAIRAAIYPQASDYNYFLSRPDTGATVFSKTLAEHNANKRKYLQ